MYSYVTNDTFVYTWGLCWICVWKVFLDIMFCYPHLSPNLHTSIIPLSPLSACPSIPLPVYPPTSCTSVVVLIMRILFCDPHQSFPPTGTILVTGLLGVPRTNVWEDCGSQKLPANSKEGGSKREVDLGNSWKKEQSNHQYFTCSGGLEDNCNYQTLNIQNIFYERCTLLPDGGGF